MFEESGFVIEDKRQGKNLELGQHSIEVFQLGGEIDFLSHLRKYIFGLQIDNTFCVFNSSHAGRAHIVLE